MTTSARHLAICLLLGSAVLVQAGQNPNRGGQSGQQGDGDQGVDRPTLGPRTGPSEVEPGPPPSATTDFKKLLRIHTLYVENIDNSLSDKLVEALGGWGRIKLVAKPKDADAMLRGTCLESRHLKHVHSEVFISDHSGKSIWQDVVYRPYNPPTLSQAVDDTAKLVLAHLEQSIRLAERQ